MSRKIIKIGSSAGVTIPKDQLEELGLKVGDKVNVSIEPAEETLTKHKKLTKEYEDFVEKYGQTLKNLAKR